MATKKTTIKHLVDGTVHTRTTARVYTHVVLTKVHAPMAIASIEKNKAACLKQARENAVFCWDYAANNRAEPVGGRCFFGKYQVAQSQKEEADRFFAEFGHLTREEYIAQREAAEAQSLERAIARLRTETHSWQVAAWSGSAALAAKAAATRQVSHNRFTRVEAINSGVAA